MRPPKHAVDPANLIQTTVELYSVCVYATQSCGEETFLSASVSIREVSNL